MLVTDAMPRAVACGANVAMPAPASIEPALAAATAILRPLTIVLVVVAPVPPICALTELLTRFSTSEPVPAYWPLEIARPTATAMIFEESLAVTNTSPLPVSMSEVPICAI